MLRRKMIIIILVSLYSIYSFVYATLDNFIDYKILLIFSFLASFTLFPSKKILFSKRVAFIYLYFLGLSILGVFFRPPAYTANIDSLVRSLATLLLSGPIVACFVNYDESDKICFRWGLFSCLLTLALMVILHQFGVPVKKALPEFAGFRPVFHTWNQKYYAAWLVFLMWGTISFHWRKSALGTFLSIGVMIFTGIAIFTGYSDAARAALILGMIIFIVMHINYSRWLLFWQSSIWLYIFAFPLVWSLLSPDRLLFTKSITLHGGSFRVRLYSFTANLIWRHWFLGCGFGCALPVLSRFPFETGGHPHNIVLLFWLELGMLGACLLAITVTLLLSFIDRTTHGRRNAPAVWALFGSGLVIFSFSFDIWLPGIVLIYDMWLAMIILACQNTTHSHSPAQNDPRELSGDD
jgi:O-antigen ligase